jgi:hypothetical protein
MAKARIIESPRGVGAILANQINPNEGEKGNIYRTLGRSIYAPSDRTHLCTQLNNPSIYLLPCTLAPESRYATLLYKLGTYWLSADHLVDLFLTGPLVAESVHVQNPPQRLKVPEFLHALRMSSFQKPKPCTCCLRKNSKTCSRQLIVQNP